MLSVLFLAESLHRSSRIHQLRLSSLSANRFLLGGFLRKSCLHDGHFSTLGKQLPHTMSLALFAAVDLSRTVEANWALDAVGFVLLAWALAPEVGSSGVSCCSCWGPPPQSESSQAASQFLPVLKKKMEICMHSRQTSTQRRSGPFTFNFPFSWPLFLT